MAVTQKQNIRRLLLAGLISLSLGGWMLHVRAHPPFRESTHLIPFLAGLVSMGALPVMFSFRNTAAFAYIINGMMVIIGTVTMAHFSLMHPPDPLTAYTVLFKTLFCDILILFSNFFLGKALFELDTLKTEESLARRGRFWRYPNPGWWGVHFVMLPVIYGLGVKLWR
jgi:hypothetical protein